MYKVSLVILILICVAASLSDCKKRIIPDIYIKTGIMLRFSSALYGFLLLNENLNAAFLGFASALILSFPIWFTSHLFKKMTGKKAFGGGDIKLLFMTGLFFVPDQAVLLLLHTLIFGAFSGLVYKVIFKSSRLPFAPSILAGVMSVICRLFFTI